MVDMNCFVQVILFFFRWNEVLRTQLVAIHVLTKVMNFELYFFF